MTAASIPHRNLPRIVLLALGAMCTLFLVVAPPRSADANAQFTSTRVYYQPFANTLWTTWSGSTCPAGARYSTNNGCVYANSVSSHATLRYTNLDGSGTTDIPINCAAGTNPHWQAPWNGVNKILVDEVNGKLYWENSFEPGIARANLDGSGCELIANGGYYGKGMIALDPSGDYLYSIQNNAVRRVKISDGTVTSLTFSGQGITVTGLGDMVVHNGKLYVAISNSGSAGHIMEATIDTTSSTQTARLIVTSQATGMNGLDVDSVNNKIYWATGSAVKRANLDGTSIETVYSGTATFVQVLPTENKILMGSAAANNVFTTNMSGGSVTSLNVGAGGYVTAVVANVAPATTTTVAATTTSTVPSTTSTTQTTLPTASTVPSSTTTLLASTTTAVVASGSGSGIASGSGSGKTVEKTTGSTSTSTTSTTTSTTVAPAPSIDGGEGVIEVDGVATATEVSRNGNRFSIKAGNVSATLTGITSAGEIAPLDEDGAVRLTNVDMFEVEMDGFSSNSQVEVWMYSTPQKLGEVKVDAMGSAKERYSIPQQIESGMHRVVLRGENAQGKKIEVAFGMYVGAKSQTSTAARVLIAIPIAMAILVGLLLPTALRRRRRADSTTAA
jgi:hypothetical protein